MSQKDFDAMCNQFDARVHRASCWRSTYFGAAYSTRIKQAIQELKDAIAEAERHPEIAPKT